MTARKPRLEWVAYEKSGGSRAVLSVDGVTVMTLCVDEVAPNDFDWGVSPSDDFTAMNSCIEADSGEPTNEAAQLAAEDAALALLKQAVAALEPTP